jgi:hypothetical protein
MTDKSPTEILQFYRVDGTVPPLVVGVQRNGRVLLGQNTLLQGYEWIYAISNPGGITALQEVLEQARVDQRNNWLDTVAAEYVTNEMVAAATAAFEGSDEDTDRGRMIDALGATPLLSSFTADDALGAFRRANPGEGVRAGLLAVARSRIADGTIKP